MDAPGLTRGEPWAWAQAYKKWATALKLFIRTRLIGHPDDEDIKNETFTRLIQKSQRGVFEDIQLPGLMYAEAQFVIRDYWRAKARQGRPLDGEAVEEPLEPWAAPADDALVQLLIHEDRAALDKAIRTLTPSQREALRLVYREGLTARDAALRMNISVQRVRELLMLARKRLHAHFQAQGE